MKDKHLGATDTSMNGHWIHHCHLFERTQKALTHDEASHVGLVYDEDGKVDETSFCCLQCPETPIISKRGCLKHFVHSRTLHSLDLATVNKWLVTKDSFQLAKHALGKITQEHLDAHMCLTHGWAFAAGEQAALPEDPADQLVPMPDDQAPDDARFLCDDMDVAVPEPALVTLDDGSHWKAMWVRVDAAGQPFHPAQLREVNELYVDGAAETVNPHTLVVGASSTAQPVSVPQGQVILEGVERLAPQEPAILERVERLVEKIEEKQKKADEYECDRPKVSVSEFCLSWRKTDLKTVDEDGNPLEKKRCPIPDTCDLDLGAFEQYLKKIVKSDSAVTDNLTGVKRFWNLIDVDCDAPSPISILVAMFETNIHAQIFSTELMHTAYTWNNKIAKALDHFCDWAIEDAQRNRWKNAEHAIGQVKSDVWYYKHDTQEGQKKARKVRARKDARRIENLAPPEALKAAVKDAMKELWGLHNRLTQGGGAPTEEDRAFANVIIVGIVFLNGFAGRSGEWKLAKTSHFQEQRAAGLNFLECDMHKTARYYGTLAKHLAPGTIKALELYTSLPNKHTDLLFDPIRGSTKDASVHKALHKFGELFLNDTERPGVTLLRKMFHSKLIQMHREGQCLDLLAKADAHSLNVAIDVYTVIVPENDAKLGSILYEQVMGAPVDWPSEGELLAWSRKGSTRASDTILEEADIASDDEELADIHLDITMLQVVMVEPEEEARPTKKQRKHVSRGEATGVAQEQPAPGAASSSSQGGAVANHAAAHPDDATQAAMRAVVGSRKIDPDLAVYIFQQHFAEEHGREQCMSRAWFNALRTRALAENKMKDESAVTAEGMRTFVRNFFARDQALGAQGGAVASQPLQDAQVSADDIN